MILLAEFRSMTMWGLSWWNGVTGERVVSVPWTICPSQSHKDATAILAVKRIHFPFAAFHPCAIHARRCCPRWFLGLRLGDTPGRSGDASMDTVCPVVIRGHSTVSVGARRHWLSEHAAHSSPDTRTQRLMHRHSWPLQLPDDVTMVVVRAAPRAARRVVARA